MPSKASQVNARPPCGALYPASSFLSSAGRLWPASWSIKVCEMHLTKVSRAFANGMAMLTAHHRGILSVLVSFVTCFSGIRLMIHASP